MDLDTQREKGQAPHGDGERAEITHAHGARVRELRELLTGEEVDPVQWLQAALRVVVAPALDVDGRWGPATRAATRKFQEMTPFLVGGRGPEFIIGWLGRDGEDGPKTRAALRLTLERMLVMAQEQERRCLALRAQIVEGGKSEPASVRATEGVLEVVAGAVGLGAVAFVLIVLAILLVRGVT